MNYKLFVLYLENEYREKIFNCKAECDWRYRAQPYCCGLFKNFYPNAQIDWVVSDKCRGLIENNPLINNVYVADISKWRKNWLFSIPEIIKFTNIIKKKKL